MDNLTHTLVGAVTAQGFLKKKVGPEAVPILCWASNLPDIDALVMLKHDPAAITLRRTFGHSVFLFPVWAFLLALIFKKVYPHKKLSTLYLLCLLGAALHVFFDLINSFGVVALWPFSLYRPELAIVFIVDFFLLALLIAPFAAARWLPAWRGRLKDACRASAAAVGVYLLFCAGARAQAEVRLLRQTAGLKPELTYVFPEPLGPQRWRGVVRFGDEYRLYLIRTFSARTDLWGIQRTDEDTPAVEAVKRSSPLAQRLLAFFKAPVWSVRPDPGGQGALVTLYDLRFVSLVFPQRRGFTYRFLVRPDGVVEERGLAKS